MPCSTAGASCLLHLIVNQQRAGLGSRLPSCSLHSATLRCTDKLHVIPACETQPQQPSSMMKIASVGLHVTTPFYSSHSKNARSKAPILLSWAHKKATANTHTHTQPFNGLFSRTTWVSRYQKGKTNLDFTAARDSEWQWHQLGHMQVCTSLKTDNHASTPPLCFYRPDALPAAQPTASKH